MRLHLYFARRFLATFLTVALALSLVFVLLDMVEHIRKFDMSVIGFVQILWLTILHLPSSIYQILPLIVILAALFLFLGLSRSSELVVVRAAGRSALMALLAPAIVVLTLGTLALAVLNPIAASTTREYDRRVSLFGGGDESIFSISAEGLWLRQGDTRGQTVIRATEAQTTTDGTFVLTGVTFFAFTPEGVPRSRIDAETARLESGRWALSGVKVWTLEGSDNPEHAAVQSKVWFVATTLTADEINSNLGATSAISIWDMPQVIRNLEQAGFSTRRQQVGLQVDLAMPLFLVSMLLIGAAFTMRHARLGQTGVMVLSALLLGFGIYFVRNFAHILGENGQIPILVAAWTPPIAATMLALGVILNLEDG